MFLFRIFDFSMESYETLETAHSMKWVCELRFGFVGKVEVIVFQGICEGKTVAEKENLLFFTLVDFSPFERTNFHAKLHARICVSSVTVSPLTQLRNDSEKYFLLFVIAFAKKRAFYK